MPNTYSSRGLAALHMEHGCPGMFSLSLGAFPVKEGNPCVPPRHTAMRRRRQVRLSAIAPLPCPCWNSSAGRSARDRRRWLRVPVVGCRGRSLRVHGRFGLLGLSRRARGTPCRHGCRQLRWEWAGPFPCFFWRCRLWHTPPCRKRKNGWDRSTKRGNGPRARGGKRSDTVPLATEAPFAMQSPQRQPCVDNLIPPAVRVGRAVPLLSSPAAWGARLPPSRSNVSHSHHGHATPSVSYVPLPSCQV